MLACFLGGFVILFIPFFTNLILTNITFIETGFTYYGYYNDSAYCSDLMGTNVIVSTANSGMRECHF